MTELRERMIESLQLRGMSERTQEAYVRAARQLAEHYHKSPDLISAEELRQYLLFLKNVKKFSRASMTNRLLRDEILLGADPGLIQVFDYVVVSREPATSTAAERQIDRPRADAMHSK